MTEAFNIDCMEAMAQMGDNEFDLAIVDPPYGLGDRLMKGGKKGGMGSLRKLGDDKIEKWDNVPNKKYFNELFRISKDQIIWGANYFIDHLSSNDGIIIWDKMNGTNMLSDAEIAWKSLDGTTRIFRLHHFSKGYGNKIHPTQKPVALYKWILKNYATCSNCGGSGEVSSLTPDCDVQTCGQCRGKILRIIDTHLGSGSLRIAAHDMGFDFVGYEIDKDYFDAQEKRFQNHISQGNLFEPNQMY